MCLLLPKTALPPPPGCLLIMSRANISFSSYHLSVNQEESPFPSCSLSIYIHLCRIFLCFAFYLVISFHSDFLCQFLWNDYLSKGHHDAHIWSGLHVLYKICFGVIWTWKICLKLNVTELVGHNVAKLMFFTISLFVCHF